MASRWAFVPPELSARIHELTARVSIALRNRSDYMLRDIRPGYLGGVCDSCRHPPPRMRILSDSLIYPV
jgi:hypothetical protein